MVWEHITLGERYTQGGMGCIYPREEVYPGWCTSPYMPPYCTQVGVHLPIYHPMYTRVHHTYTVISIACTPVPTVCPAAKPWAQKGISPGWEASERLKVLILLGLVGDLCALLLRSPCTHRIEDWIDEG